MNSSLAKMMEKYIEPMDYYLALQAAGRDLILHNAPVLIVLHGPALSFFASDNCNIAAANICNYAHSMGLGTCFIGFVTLSSRFSKKLCSLLKLPKGRTIYSSLVVGHPKYSYPYTASRKPPKIQWLMEPPDAAGENLF
jgi:nitroreductase